MSLGYSTQKHNYGANDSSHGDSNEVLYRVRSSQILELFPDELVVEEKTISIVRREFLSTFVETLPVKNLLETTLTAVGPFATITFMDKSRKQVTLHNLPTLKAEKAKRVIDALLSENESVLQSHQKLVNQYS